MRITKLADTEILVRLEQLAEQSGVKLAFAHKCFYLSILKLCEEQGKFDSQEQMYYVKLSISNFAKKFCISPTTVFQSLQRLVQCEALRHKKDKNTTSVNSAYCTYFIKSVYL